MENNYLPKWCWCSTEKCVVEVIKIGHFPNTVIVRLPSDTTIEVERTELETCHDHAKVNS